jgi:geranylgeranyl pyrophosphate synthase
MSDVDRQLAAWRETFDRELDEALSAERTGAPPTLLAAMRHAALAGGKRLRPLLILATAQGCGEDPASGFPAALAVEMIHTYSLIHDDLPAMDDDELRRGRPTCHVVYGEAAAILAGDALQTLAFETLTRSPLPADRICRQVATLSRAAGAAGMTGGQVLDLEAEGAASVDTALVERIHRMKTGALIAACLRLGAEAAGREPGTAESLERIGLELGLAFQIKDDVLDCTSTAEELGKTVGKDVGHDKATWPAVVGLHEAERHAEQLVMAALEDLGFLDGPVDPLRRLVELAVDRSS